VVGSLIGYLHMMPLFLNKVRVGFSRQKS